MGKERTVKEMILEDIDYPYLLDTFNSWGKLTDQGVVQVELIRSNLYIASEIKILRNLLAKKLK